MQLHLIITNLKNIRENGFERISQIEINRVEVDELVPLYDDFGNFIWNRLIDLQNQKYNVGKPTILRRHSPTFYNHHAHIPKRQLIFSVNLVIYAFAISSLINYVQRLNYKVIL